MDGTSHNADKPGAAKQGKPRSKQRSRKPQYSHKTVSETGERKEQPFDEREVVRRAQQRDLFAIDELCDHYIEGVHRYFYRKVWNVSLAEELTAETFCRLVENIDQFRWQGKRFGSWVRGIARHVFLERLREIKKERLTEPLTEPSDDLSLFSSNSEALIDTDANILEGIIWKEERDILWRLIEDLPLEYQSILTLRHVYDLSYLEIVSRYGRSERAWMQQHYRALKMLRQKILDSNLREDLGWNTHDAGYSPP